MYFRALELAENTVRAHREIAFLCPADSLSFEDDNYVVLDDTKRDLTTFVNMIEANGDFSINVKGK